MDLGSVGGLALAVVTILGGQLLQGGSLLQIIQLTAAFIVLGGTFAAIWIATPGADLTQAKEKLPLIFREVKIDIQPMIEQITEIAGIARKDGVLSLESQRATLKDPILIHGIRLIIDGFEQKAIREILEAEIEKEYQAHETAARVFENAGSYAPTIGILAAVLGLIQVLSMLNDPSKLGAGIAVAFVATVYGLGLANLVLLPFAAKLKRKAEMLLLPKQIALLGVLGIQDQMTPGFLKEKLQAYVHEQPVPQQKK